MKRELGFFELDAGKKFGAEFEVDRVVVAPLAAPDKAVFFKGLDNDGERGIVEDVSGIARRLVWIVPAPITGLAIG